jgi:ketosteroid isomerase-like protein
MALLTPDTAADHVAIRELTGRFSDAVSRRDSAGMSALFEPDGSWVVPGIGETVGRSAVATMLDRLLAQFPFLVQLAHGGQVEVTGDTARARWQLSELARDGEDKTWLFVGVYQDRLIRTADGWFFRRRQFDFLYRGRPDLSGRTYPYPELDGAYE